MPARVPWACLGVPIDSVGSPDGGPPFGTELAPSALRDRDIVARLGAADLGDADVRVTGSARDPVSGIVGWPSVGSMTTAVRAAVGQTISGGERPFLLGGCCALVMGAVAGARDTFGRIGLVNVDGHLDLYDHRTSPTGEAADMPSAAILGLGWPGLLALLGPVPLLPGTAVALLGARDEDEARDLDDLPRRLGVAVGDGPACLADPAGTAASVSARFAAAGLPYWLHLDVDVLSEEVFPATDYLMPGGLDLPALTVLLSEFGRVRGWPAYRSAATTRPRIPAAGAATGSPTRSRPRSPSGPSPPRLAARHRSGAAARHRRGHRPVSRSSTTARRTSA